MTTSNPAPSQEMRFLLKFVAWFALLTLASVWVSQSSGDQVVLWFGNTVVIACLIGATRKRAIGVLLCAAVIMLTIFVAAQLPWRWLVLIPVQLVETNLAAWLITRSNSAEKFTDDPKRLAYLLCSGVFVPVLLGATIAAALVAGTDYYWPSWWAWLAGSMIAGMGMLPLVLLLVQLGWLEYKRRVQLKPTLIWSMVALCTNVFALNFLPFPFIYVLVPLTIAAIVLNFESIATLVCLSTATTGVTIALGHLAIVHLHDGALWKIYLPYSLTIIPPLLAAAGMRQSRLREEARREAEQALERRTQDLYTIIDHTPAMIGYWDRDLRNQFANRAYQDWFGMSQELMHNSHLRDIIGETRYANNLPFIESVLRGESPVYEREITDRHGKTFNVLASYVPDLVDGETKGFYSFINDVTPLIEAQREQSAAQELLQSIIDAASEFSIIATGLDGTIRVFSSGAERMLGFQASEMVGKTTPLILHVGAELDARARELELDLGRAVSGFAILTENVRDDHADVVEWTYQRKDGSQLPVRLVVTAMHDGHGAVIGYLGIAKDISRQRQLQTSLVKAKELAEAASRAKSEFVANMSHEIRTPLNAVLGMAHLLGTTPLSHDQREYLEMIRISGSSLLSIINDILDFSKIEAGRMDIVSEPFKLWDVLGAVANIMMVNSGERDLELALGVTTEVPTQLIGDALHLQQVLVNLVSNAIKFTESGEVSLQVDCVSGPSEVEVVLHFSVRDTGIGMEKGQQDKLFSAFSQADSSTTRRFGGTGLGLAICKRLVALMKGQIQLDSQPGAGTLFRVSLPMLRMVDMAPPANQTQGLCVLVIDDNNTSLSCLCNTIRSLGWQADGIVSGEQAIAQAIARTQQPYDLILIDWQMPDTDSFSIMQRIRSSVSLFNPDLHIAMMVSAFGRGTLLGDQNALLADTILVKPVTAENLLAMTEGGKVIVRRDGDRTAPFELITRKWDRRLDGSRILLVEDNHLNQVVARGMLMQAGAMVDVLDNGLKAVEQLAECTQYDIILMDVQMPVMDGCTAARKIRGELQLKIPILAMTAGVMTSEREQCVAAGMSDFIPKPIDVEQMFNTILRYLPVRVASRPGQPAPQDCAAVGQQSVPSQAFNPDLVMQVGQNNAAYRNKMLDLIRNVVLQSPSQFLEARQAYEAGQKSDAAKILHGMRSSLGMLGARQFSAATVAIEKNLHDSNAESALSLFDFAAANLEQTMREASLWLERQV